MEGMLYFRDFFYINVVNLIFFEGQKNTILQGKWSKKFLGIKGVKDPPLFMRKSLPKRGGP